MSEKLAADLESALRGFAARGGTPAEAATIIRTAQKMQREKRKEGKERAQNLKYGGRVSRAREALRLRNEGLTYREIAETMGGFKSPERSRQLVSLAERVNRTERARLRGIDSWTLYKEEKEQRKDARRKKRQTILDLRREGMIYRKIGTRVGITVSQASAVVKREEGRLAEEAEQEAMERADREVQERLQQAYREEQKHGYRKLDITKTEAPQPLPPAPDG